MATKRIAADENIVLCPSQSAFTVATVLRDDSFMRDAFGFSLSAVSASSSSLEADGGSCGVRKAVYLNTKSYRDTIQSILISDQQMNNEIPKDLGLTEDLRFRLPEISFYLQDPIKSSLGSSSIVRQGQMIMALYMATAILEKAAEGAVLDNAAAKLLEVVLADISASATTAPIDARVKASIFSQIRDFMENNLFKDLSATNDDPTTTAKYMTSGPGSYVNYFRFFPSHFMSENDPVGHINEMVGDFADFSTIMAGGVMQNTPGGLDCTRWLLDRFADVTLREKVQLVIQRPTGKALSRSDEAYYDGLEALQQRLRVALSTGAYEVIPNATATVPNPLPSLSVLKSENDSKSVLIWALAMIYSRSTVVDHAPTLQKCFEGLLFPSTSDPRAVEKFFSPDTANPSVTANASPSDTTASAVGKSVHRDKLLPMMCPIIDLCNHTSDSAKENVAVYVPDVEQQHTRMVCLRSLRSIAPGEELCMMYGVGDRELDVFYGMRGKYRLP
eukprot:GDKK01000012.1.p1 GENE.GDKK01000012.1~~GDKK01000012.1.p1  ORF type:complete len:512 (-),score=41.12 GDKK01000012.1:36-1544(-)